MTSLLFWISQSSERPLKLEAIWWQIKFSDVSILFQPSAVKKFSHFQQFLSSFYFVFLRLLFVFVSRFSLVSCCFSSVYCFVLFFEAIWWQIKFSDVSILFQPSAVKKFSHFQQFLSSFYFVFLRLLFVFVSRFSLVSCCFSSVYCFVLFFENRLFFDVIGNWQLFICDQAANKIYSLRPQCKWTKIHN